MTMRFQEEFRSLAVSSRRPCVMLTSLVRPSFKRICGLLFRVCPKDLVAVRRWPKHSCGMKRMLCWTALLLPTSGLAGAVPGLAAGGDSASRDDQKLADYFRAETGVIASHCLADIRSLEDWQARRGEYRRQKLWLPCRYRQSTRGAGARKEKIRPHFPKRVTRTRGR